MKNLINERNSIISQKKNCLSEKRKEQLDIKIAELESEQIRNDIMKKFQLFSRHPENINLTSMWKLLKKVSPKIKPLLPTAKRNNKGNIVSGPQELKKLLAKEYKNRLRTRPVRPDLMEMRTRKQLLFRKK